MIGTAKTSVKITDNSGVDEHTVFLMRDSLYDYSKNKVAIYPSGNGWDATGVSVSSAQIRDNRNAIVIGGSGYIVLAQPNIINLCSDYTIEFWRYFAQNNSGSGIVTIRGKFTTYIPCLLIGYASQNIQSGLYAGTTAGSWDIIENKTMGTYTTGVWNHMCLSKHENTYYCFKDGTLTATYSTDTTFKYPYTEFFAIGAWCGSNNSFSPNAVMAGYLQDFRVSDICRYTSNFTPPERL